MKKQLISFAMAALAMPSILYGQGGSTGNNSTGLSTQFLGYGSGVTAPLNIRNNLNASINFFTNNINRIVINPSLTSTIRGVAGQVTDGFVGIGRNGYFAGNTPYSMLHLQGLNNGIYGSGGWRKWMNTGAYMEENSDNMYVGMKNGASEGQGIDRSDAVIGWSDNYTGPPYGPDVLRFIFTGNTNGNGNNTNSLDGNSLNGYEFMRMTTYTATTNSAGFPEGHVGIGPLFVYGNTAPQNRLHMNSEDYLDNYLQITSAKATGQLDANGIKFGLYNVAGNSTTATAAQQLEMGNAFLYNQGTRHLILSTNHTTPTTASGGMFATNERVRITSFNAPTVLPGNTTYGTYIPPGSGNTNTTDNTRIGISYNPSNPVTRPLSLLHLGINATAYPNASNLDGWRPWMEIGTFTNSDFGVSMYSGLKFSTTSDAVIGWGYNQTVPKSSGVRMRFIFTTPTPTGPLLSANTNGIEAAHFYSDGNNTRMGVGDFQTPNLDPRNTLEVLSSTSSPYYVAAGNHNSSGLKFRNLTCANTPIPNQGNMGVLALDTGGNVIYVPAGGGGGGGTVTGAQNGNSISTFITTDVVLGQDLTQYGTTNTAQFLNDRYVPMNTQSILFGDGNAAPVAPFNNPNTTIGNTFNIGVGFNPFGTAQSKFFTGNDQYGVGGVFATQLTNYKVVSFPASSFNYLGSNFGVGPTGVVGYAESPTNTPYEQPMTGVYGFANNNGITTNPNVHNINPYIVGVRGEAVSSNGGAGVVGISAYSTALGTNYGGAFWAGGGANNCAVYAAVLGTTGTNYAFYSNGNSLAASGCTWATSDSTLKNNINPITNGMATIMQLKPKSFYFDTTNTVGLNLSPKKQYGFLAQNIQTILPELTNTFYAPNDSTFSTPYSALNYNAFIGLLTAGMQQQQLSIDSLRSKPSGGALGNVCGISSTNPLSSAWEVPLNGHSFVFTNQYNQASCNVSIGDYNCSPYDKLEVVGQSADAETAISLKNNNTTLSTTFAGALFTDVPSGSQAWIKKFSANYTDPSQLEVYNNGNIFIHTPNSGAKINITANNGPVELGNVNPANETAAFSAVVHGNALVESDPGFASYLQLNSGTNPVGILEGDGNGGQLYLYPYGNTSPSIQMTAFASPQVNIGQKVSPSGMLNVLGSVYSAGNMLTSDSTLKTNIQPLTNTALQKIQALRPVSFQWITKYDTLMYGTKYGFTAQQVQNVLPDLVSTDSAGLKSLNYTEIIPFLTKAIQEQQQTIDSLKASNNKRDSLIAALANAITTCCANNSRTQQTGFNQVTGSNSQVTDNSNAQNVTLSDVNAIVLNQNQPNPFAEQTTITYTIPQTAGNAQLLFYDVLGKQINNVTITTRGAGQLNVYANDLTNGVYSYTLIVDGQIIDTKKMVKQQ